MPNFKHTKSDKKLISEALNKSIQIMGISKSDFAEILMIDPEQLNDFIKSSFESNSQKVQISLQIIKIYRSLFALAGNNKKFMTHFLYTDNHYFSARPIDVMKSLPGLVKVEQFLNAMCEKV